MKDDIKLPPLNYDELPEVDDAIPAMHAYAIKAIKADRQRRSEPVAWHTEDHLTDKSATTYDPVVAKRWAEKGWPVTPLFYAPQPAEQVQSLKRDKERLDWLADPENSIGNVQLPRVCVERNLHSLRDAIDDARGQKK